MGARIIATMIGLHLAVVPTASAYSVLAHEAAIDVSWDRSIAPLLKLRYPDASADALLRARSFAYGGSVIQDLGYYPFGSRFFSNLLHYARSGDFVEALLRESRNLDELAFAIGALAHYADDNTGHPEAVNRAVAAVFPKLRQKYGNSVTYVEGPTQHVTVEFSFDVVEAAGGAYLPEAYQRFIGFRVATGLLQRAFVDTYGLQMQDVFADMDRSITTYRYSVSQIIPALTTAAWRDKHDEIVKLHPSLARSGFVFAYGRASFEQEYGDDYQRPGWFARFLGVVYRLLPKIGPLKPLSFKTPTPEAEAMFVESFRDARARLDADLRLAARRQMRLTNTNFDTGRPARHGDYALADDTFAEWLKRLERSQFATVTPPIRRELRAFYGATPGPSPVGRRDRKHWADTAAALRALQ